MHRITEEFEKELCEYTGSKYACCVDNASNGIYLALTYLGIKGKTIKLPNHTYMSVPCEVILAGGKVEWTMNESKFLTGAYRLVPTPVWDSALRFTADMFQCGMYMVLSFTGPYKHLKLGKGGCIIHDDPNAVDWFKRARNSGRGECSYHEDTFKSIGRNCYMMPEIAARGLLLMKQFYNHDGSKKHNEDLTMPYPDLSKFEVYTK